MRLLKVVVHSDVILDHLLHRQPNASVLRLAMMKFFCYTTVFNAIELFSLARTAKEVHAVEDAMSAMKILGLNAKQAKRYGDWFAHKRSATVINKLVAGICMESKLPLVTGNVNDFRGIRGLSIIRSTIINAKASAAEIYAMVKTQ